MQTSKNQRSSHFQSPNMKSAYTSAKYKKEDNRLTLIILGVLSLLLPPVGILLSWRAQNVEIRMRAAFTGTALASTVLIFFLLMRPTGTVSMITPVPETPQLVGYGAAMTEQPIVTPVPEAPAQFAAPAPGTPAATDDPAAVQEPGELTDDTIVYAVTNNAASYHLYELCDQQENRRALTLREALNEGLQPCEKCVGAMG